MENYFSWLQTGMSAFPWGNTNLNRILMSQATQNVTAAVAFMQKLSRAKNYLQSIVVPSSGLLTGFGQGASLDGSLPRTGNIS
jgi:hypothetical protein